MYIPVADATDGKTPRLSMRGLNIAPPPRPSAPDMNPPRNAKVTNFNRTILLSLRSLGAKPAPTLVLRDYSYRTLRAAKIVNNAQKSR